MSDTRLIALFDLARLIRDEARSGNRMLLVFLSEDRMRQGCRVRAYQDVFTACLTTGTPGTTGILQSGSRIDQTVSIALDSNPRK